MICHESHVNYSLRILQKLTPILVGVSSPTLDLIMHSYSTL